MPSLDRGNAVQLPALQKHGADPLHRIAEGQLVRPVADEYVLGPKSGQSAIGFAVVVIENVGAAIAEVLGVDPARIIDRSRKRVRKLRAQTMRELLLRAQLQRVVKGLSVADPLGDAGEVRIHASGRRL